jgi:hypothetical protein
MSLYLLLSVFLSFPLAPGEVRRQEEKTFAKERKIDRRREGEIWT